MSQRFTACQWVPFPREFVFAFFANPYNLPRLMPPALKTRIDQLNVCKPTVAEAHDSALSTCNAAGTGSTISISFCPLTWIPFRVRWVARISEFVQNSHFCDEQIQGPFAQFRHRHGTRTEYREDRPGTLVTDDIEYSLPFGAVGRLADNFVHGQLERSFAQRQKRLPELLAIDAGMMNRAH